MPAGDDLDVYGAHDNVYFGRDADGVLESEFSGNLVEVCPDRRVHRQDPLRALQPQMGYAQRALDLRALRRWAATPLASERAGELRRIVNRYQRRR